MNVELLPATIPAAWLNILRKVRGVYPEAILAGGAMRDLTVRGITMPKDLDIFVPWVAHEFSAGWDEIGDAQCRILDDLIPHLGAGRRLIEGDEDYENDPAMEVWDVFEFPGTPKVQIIALNPEGFSVDRVLSRMDFGICQIGTDAASAFKTDAFYQDLTNQTLTYMRDGEPNPDRVGRLTEIFPRWSLVA